MGKTEPRRCQICGELIGHEPFYRVEFRRYDVDRSIGEITATVCEECAQEVGEQIAKAVA